MSINRIGRKEPYLSKRAAVQAAALGRRMAKEDSWIEPTSDKMLGVDMQDYGQFCTAHREEWEQTQQWQVLWLPSLIAITEADAHKQGVFRHTDNELWYSEFQQPAKDALWEAWEDKRKLYDFWKQHVAKPVKKAKRSKRP